MFSEFVWPTILAVAAAVAGFVAFVVQALNVRKVQLENEKLKEDIHKLKAERAAREESIIRATPDDILRYGKKKSLLSQSGTYLPLIALISLVGVLYQATSMYQVATQEREAQQEFQVSAAQQMGRANQAAQSLEDEIARLKEENESLRKQVSEQNKTPEEKKPDADPEQCKRAARAIMGEIEQRFQGWIGGRSGCSNSCHVRIDKGVMTFRVDDAPANAGWMSITTLQLFDNLTCAPFVLTLPPSRASFDSKK